MASVSLASAFAASPVTCGGGCGELSVLRPVISPTIGLSPASPSSRCLVVTAFAGRSSQSSPTSQGGNPFANLKQSFPLGSNAAEPLYGRDDNGSDIDAARSRENPEDFVIIRRSDSSGRTGGDPRTAGGGGGKRGSAPSRSAPAGKDGGQQGGKGAASAKGGGVTVQATRRGRGGKTVTVVDGLRLAGGDAEVAALLKKLKTALGSGGAVKDGCLELQGDVADRVVELLGTMGIQAKRSGGK